MPDIDISHLENVMATVQRPTRHRRDPPMVNYKKGGNSVEFLRYSEDPSEIERSFLGDSRFCFPHQADWYKSVIMTMKRVTTEIKWIDWNYLKGLASPLKEVVDVVYDRCQEMDLLGIMSFSCDWNEEVVAQFYATLHVSDDDRIFQFLIGGKQFTYTMAQFSHLFGHGGDQVYYGGSYVVNRDESKVDFHAGNELDASKMHFMYDRAYGDIVLGQVKGLTPFYRLLNTLFRFTHTPREGDSDNISHRAKNLLVQMAPGKCEFAVMEFNWNEIITCASNPSSACHYAPYIFHMIKNVTHLNIVPNTSHVSYHSSKGKIEQSLHIGRHNTGIDPIGPFPGAYPSTFAPGASSSGAAPPPSRGAPSSSWAALASPGPSTSRGRRAPKERKASWISLLKEFLLASICAVRTPRRSVSIGGIWMRSF